LVESYNVLTKLIDRYDYGGALQVIKEMGFENSDAAILIESCKYAVNFDFETAFSILDRLSEVRKNKSEIKGLVSNLESLIRGEPNDMFSELIENIKFQIVNEEYIDFLGRVYRFKEAIFKYIFIKKHLNKNQFSFLLDIMSKRRILKILRKKYKIYNSNMVYAITTYINRYLSDEKRYVEIAKLLNSEKMTNLIELRNNSIVGHGFKGVSREDIVKVYGNPYHVLDDFKHCLNLLDVKLFEYKYSKLNDIIKKELNKPDECDMGENFGIVPNMI